MRGCVSVPPTIPAASTTPKSSPPNKCVRTTPGPGSRPRSSTVASAARALQGSRGRVLAARWARSPYYLLTTDPKSSAKQLLQIYFDRWQIEVNHRDEKETFGVGQ